MSQPFQYPEGFFSSYHSQKPICGVLATALAAGVIYDVAHARLKEAMHVLYPKRQRFGGMTYEPQIDLALKWLGVKFEKTVFGTGHKPKLIDLVKRFEPGVLYHVITPGHISCVKDGYLVDQSRLTRIELVSFANKRVKYMRKINGKGW